MKKIVFLFVLIELIFCGCVKSDTSVYIAKPFKAQVSVKAEGTLFVFDCDCKGSNDITLVVLKPENIKGTTIRSGDGFSCKGTSGPAKELIWCLKALFAQSIPCPSKGISYLDAESDCGKFCAQIDFESERILTLKSEKYEYLFT